MASGRFLKSALAGPGGGADVIGIDPLRMSGNPVLAVGLPLQPAFVRCRRSKTVTRIGCRMRCASHSVRSRVVMATCRTMTEWFPSDALRSTCVISATLSQCSLLAGGDFVFSERHTQLCTQAATFLMSACRMDGLAWIAQAAHVSGTRGSHDNADP